jgi:DNA-binding transcriptional regulator YbjK
MASTSAEREWPRRRASPLRAWGTDVTDRQKALAAILAAIPALLLACSQWIRADAAKREKAAAYESYGEYVTDQLHRDEALLRALRDCQDARDYRVGTAASVDIDKVLARVTEPQAQTVLDEIARREGWEGDVR